MENIIVEKVWLTDTEVWIRTTDGKEACEKFSDFQRLKWATPAQRANFTTSHDGIHWRELDEDLSFDGFFSEKQNKLSAGTSYIRVLDGKFGEWESGGFTAA